MSVALAKGSHAVQAKGTWWNDFPDAAYVGKFGVLLETSCPGCGVASAMSSKVHSVAADGTVTPSYVCPHTKAWEGHEPCTFHEWVRLEGWGAT